MAIVPVIYFSASTANVDIRLYLRGYHRDTSTRRCLFYISERHIYPSSSSDIAV